MPISTYWYDDAHRVITQRFEGNWTWDDLNRELAVMRTLAESVPYDLVAFTDLSGINVLPKGNVLAQGRSGGVTNMPDNITFVVVVVQSRLVEVFAQIFVDMLPKWRNRIQFVKTTEEGQKRVAAALEQNVSSGMG